MLPMQKLTMYKQSGTAEPRVDAEATVAQYAPMVKRMAHHLMARLPANVQLNDLIQSGMVGLLESARKYDATKGASFETYAGIRIRGAMLDDVRKEDWAPRSVHRNARRIAEAIKAVEALTGRDAQDSEVAQELGISLDEYYSHLMDSAGTRLFSFDDVPESGEDQSEKQSGFADIGPMANVQRDAFRASLAEAILTLPERERLVLALYYREELNLKEIGEVIGVSESRVSQIHSQAALRLRARLAEWGEDHDP